MERKVSWQSYRVSIPYGKGIDESEFIEKTILDVSIPYGKGKDKKSITDIPMDVIEHVSIPYGKGKAKNEDAIKYNAKSINSLWER